MACAQLWPDELIKIKIMAKIILTWLINFLQDPEEYEVAFEEMMEYISEEESWSSMEEELRGRGVSTQPCRTPVASFTKGI